jgi:NADPH:quinone reductase-like Zn-dependent oxidoreductase
VDLVKRLGADAAVDGKRDDMARVIRSFARDGVDAALVVANGKGLDEALRFVKKGGRVAYPNGVEPPPKAPDGVKVVAYDGAPGRDTFDRLNRLIGDGDFHVELGRVYDLDEAERAHRELGQHHLGKYALRVHG